MLTRKKLEDVQSVRVAGQKSVYGLNILKFVKFKYGLFYHEVFSFQKNSIFPALVCPSSPPIQITKSLVIRQVLCPKQRKLLRYFAVYGQKISDRDLNMANSDLPCL